MNIVLGGTHGLGAEIAKHLRQRGEKAFVIGRSYDNVLHGEGMRADLSSIKDVERIKETLNNLPITNYFWVAGFGYIGDFNQQTDILTMGSVNFTHALPIAQIAWRKLSHIQNGKFVVVSSTTGVKPRDNEAVYAATKHAQVGFTQSLGLEVARLKLPMKVALFLPGGMQTPFWDASRPDIFDSFLDAQKVAIEIIQDTDTQTDAYYERVIERGSL